MTPQTSPTAPIAAPAKSSSDKAKAFWKKDRNHGWISSYNHAPDPANPKKKNLSALEVEQRLKGRIQQSTATMRLWTGQGPCREKETSPPVPENLVRQLIEADKRDAAKRKKGKGKVADATVTTPPAPMKDAQPKPKAGKRKRSDKDATDPVEPKAKKAAKAKSSAASEEPPRKKARKGANKAGKQAEASSESVAVVEPEDDDEDFILAVFEEAEQAEGQEMQEAEDDDEDFLGKFLEEHGGMEECGQVGESPVKESVDDLDSLFGDDEVPGPVEGCGQSVETAVEENGDVTRRDDDLDSLFEDDDTPAPVEAPVEGIVEESDGLSIWYPEGKPARKRKRVVDWH